MSVDSFQQSCRTAPVPAYGDQQQVWVICNGYRGVFLASDKNFACKCSNCLKREEKYGSQLFTPTEFERHAGMAASKKWKYSVRVADSRYGSEGILTIGRWIDLYGDNLLPHSTFANDGSRDLARQESENTKPSGSSKPRTESRPCHLIYENKPSFSVPVSAFEKDSDPDPDTKHHCDDRRHLGNNCSSFRTVNRKRKPSNIFPLTERSRGSGLSNFAPQDAGTSENAEEPGQEDAGYSPKVEETSEQYGGDVPGSSHSGHSTQKLWEPSGEEKAAGSSGPRVSHKAAPHPLDRKPKAEQCGAQSAPNGPMPGGVKTDEPSLEDALDFSFALEHIAGRLPRDAVQAPEAQLGSGQEPHRNARGDGKRPLRTAAARAPEPAPRGDHRAAEGGAVGGGPPPEGSDRERLQVKEWTLSCDHAELVVTVELDGAAYCGQLAAVGPPPQRGVPCGPRKARTGRRRAPASRDTAASSEGGASADAGQSESVGAKRANACGPQDHISRPDPAGNGFKRQRTGGGEDRAGAESPDGGHGSPPPPLDRRSKAEHRFRRLAEQGPPPGALCSLCQLEEGEEDCFDTPEGGGVAPLSLGPLLLVRTSAITHTWAHAECARWCPEVSEGGGDRGGIPAALDGLPEAVQSARRVKCAECGQRGAAICCQARGCRRSFHLPCAHAAGCLLQEGSCAAFCPEHAEGATREQSRRSERATGRSCRARQGGPGSSVPAQADGPEDREEFPGTPGTAEAKAAADILGSMHRHAPPQPSEQRAGARPPASHGKAKQASKASAGSARASADPRRDGHSEEAGHGQSKNPQVGPGKKDPSGSLPSAKGNAQPPGSNQPASARAHRLVSENVLGIPGAQDDSSSSSSDAKIDSSDDEVLTKACKRDRGKGMDRNRHNSGRKYMPQSVDGLKCKRYTD